MSGGGQPEPAPGARVHGCGKGPRLRQPYWNANIVLTVVIRHASVAFVNIAMFLRSTPVCRSFCRMLRWPRLGALALGFSLMGAAPAAEPVPEPPALNEASRRFLPFVAGIWETVPPTTGPAAGWSILEFRPDGTGTMVIRLRLRESEQTIVARIGWLVTANKDGEPVLRLRYVRSTERALPAGVTTESTILDANPLTLKTQARRDAPEVFVRREQLPPDIVALIAQANLPATTTQEIPKRP
jgi:hypothetical protein